MGVICNEFSSLLDEKDMGKESSVLRNDPVAHLDQPNHRRRPEPPRDPSPAEVLDYE